MGNDSLSYVVMNHIKAVALESEKLLPVTEV